MADRFIVSATPFGDGPFLTEGPKTFTFDPKKAKTFTKIEALLAAGSGPAPRAILTAPSGERLRNDPE